MADSFFLINAERHVNMLNCNPYFGAIAFARADCLGQFDIGIMNTRFKLQTQTLKAFFFFFNLLVLIC